MYKTALLLASIVLASPVNFSHLYGDDSIFSSDTVDSIFSSDSKNTQTDQDLQKRIKDKISSGWFSKGYEQVGVQVKNGAVTLDGNVKTDDDKSKVEKEVRNIEGVRSLTSHIKVQQKQAGKDQHTAKDQDQASKYPQDTAASKEDEQLNYKIRDQISSGWLWDSYKDISLNSKDGVVEVKGEVSSLKDEQNLVNDIRKVEGVKSVKSLLKVKESK